MLDAHRPEESLHEWITRGDFVFARREEKESDPRTDKHEEAGLGASKNGRRQERGENKSLGFYVELLCATRTDCMPETAKVADMWNNLLEKVELKYLFAWNFARARESDALTGLDQSGRDYLSYLHRVR